MKITKQELLDALATLDPTADSQWTEEGLPSLEAVQGAALDDTITREDLSENANGFCRDVAAEAIKNAKDSDAAAAEALKAAADLGKVTPKVDPEPEADTEKALRLEKLQADLAEAKKALVEHDAAVDRAKKVRAGLTQAIDKTQLALDREFPPVNQATATQAWLASEAEKRAQRAAAFNVHAAKSPIDQSFARRTGHGHGRKPVPMLAQG